MSKEELSKTRRQMLKAGLASAGTVGLLTLFSKKSFGGCSGDCSKMCTIDCPNGCYNKVNPEPA